MHGADLVKLNEAAQYLGVSSTMLATKVAAGGVPEAVQDRNEWTIPLAELASVAGRHGWLLDLTDANTSTATTSTATTSPASTSSASRTTASRTTATSLVANDPIDLLAAHAAVVLAKAQATAARAKATQLQEQLHHRTAELDQTRSESQKLSETISHLRNLNFQMNRDREQSEERVKNLLDQLTYEKTQRIVQSQELLQVRREFNRLQLATLSWRARRRLRPRR